jgi:hypothetical protein
MSLPLTTGCTLSCSFGVAPSPFVADGLGLPQVLGALPAATIMAIVPFTNVMPFGMCQSMANPTVASATAAAMGVLTPMPCVPVIAGPWAPPSVATTSTALPLATTDSKCTCSWGGVISVAAPVAGPLSIT